MDCKDNAIIPILVSFPIHDFSPNFLKMIPSFVVFLQILNLITSKMEANAIVCKLPGRQVDVKLRVFSQAIQCHSLMLKLGSAWFSLLQNIPWFGGQYSSTRKRDYQISVCHRSRFSKQPPSLEVASRVICSQSIRIILFANHSLRLYCLFKAQPKLIVRLRPEVVSLRSLEPIIGTSQ